jgi:hypothetical protein
MFEPAPKKLASLKLAHGMRLRNGQIISDGAPPRGAPKRPTPIVAHEGMRSRTDGHDVITPHGPAKDRSAAPLNPGVRSRNNDPMSG